jgi:hypothetical protein
MTCVKHLVLVCFLLSIAIAHAASDEEIASDIVTCAAIAEHLSQSAPAQQQLQYSQRFMIFITSAIALTSSDYVNSRRLEALHGFKSALAFGDASSVRSMITSALGKCTDHMTANKARIAERQKELGLASDAPIQNVGKFVLPIPNQGWQISFATPPLIKLRENDTPTQYMYHANSARFNLSFFVETPRCANATTNEDAYKCYQAMRDPSKESLKRQEETRQSHASYYRSSYKYSETVQGRSFEQLHINYYFVFQGKWMDLHISMVNPTKEDLDFLSEFEKSLRYEKTN